VAAGDSIEFSAGRGANATYSNDSTGLAAGVVPAAAVGAPRWLVTDQLGTPRMEVDQTGSLAGVTRHDYFPFGEEIGAGIGGRTTNQGYVGSNLRQRWAQLERDGETGLDYAQARYYSLPMGRFTGVDPENAGANESEPQSWNGYSYVQNNPLAFVDPQGLERCASQNQDGSCAEWVGDYDGERSKELSMFKDGTYWNAKKQVWESGAAFRDRMSENPIWAISLHMKRMEQPTTRLSVGVALAPFVALGGAKGAAVAGAEITIGRGLTTLGSLGRAGAPAGAAVLNQLGRGDRAIFQRAAQLGASAKNNFLANLEAVTRAVVERYPGGGVTRIGNIGNSPIFGSTATKVGIAEVNGQTVVVRIVQGQPKILGPLP
jgi:RHS repeat-associated protein